MEANVQYNDFRGSVAADLSYGLPEDKALAYLLQGNGYDSERYSPVGV